MQNLTITAILRDGPLKGTRIDVEVVGGRPPMTVELPANDQGGACRYCLDALVQGGQSADYTFLYRV